MTETLKSLLRPVRNILLPSSPPETAQTSEERDVERNVARTKGFTYLKSMDEILSWDEKHEDAIQRSSIPLLKRPPRPNSIGSEQAAGEGAKTMLIHDFGAAYHDYEASSQRIPLDEEQFCLETGELQFCTSFIYFAHYLVSCPPPGWVDWCHGNGVECLGTFIVEAQMGKEGMGRILLERDEEGSFGVARVLGRMARWVGFDGWLVNIEGIFEEGDWDVGLMVAFLEELRGYGVVVWYDALTTTNKISHQNALTPLNLPFVLASSALLTNYTWNPSLITSSLTLAAQHNLDPQNIYFGIDIWAQNRPHSFLHPRLTWPLFNGGGTNTGFAVKKCAEMGVSAGLFAPGWCWEHFSSTADRRKVQESLWRGAELDRSVRCDCKAGFWGGDVHRTREYLGNGIMRFAKEGVVGCKSGFWTGFERSFRLEDGEDGQYLGGKRMFSQLGSQGIMPIHVEEGKKDIWWSVDDEKPGILSIIAASSPTAEPESSERYLKLYNLGIPLKKDTTLILRYHRPHHTHPQPLSILLKLHSSTGTSRQTIPLPATTYENTTLNHTLSPTSNPTTTIKELGLLFTGTLSSEQQQILHLTSLSLGPPSSFPSTSRIRITDIALAIQGSGQWKHARLTWRITPPPLPETETETSSESESEFWSRITGPIAYFEVSVDGVLVGRACGLEFVLSKKIVEKWRNDGVVVELVGVLFGGARLDGVRVWLREGWEGKMGFLGGG
ncbi:hypothetical protein FKW77_004772 [Venturia effusa]|uniref:Cytosolic endo-beta-N-acetylglucosaminidase TIM barrel domain-containing protein n=1 Tax=Venturia effusa TaxID=50376 RepID=A0A517LMR3_9PEZI|nr:hypothetical protein FKW77_004772 [Venturia effusa]